MSSCPACREKSWPTGSVAVILTLRFFTCPATPRGYSARKVCSTPTSHSSKSRSPKQPCLPTSAPYSPGAHLPLPDRPASARAPGDRTGRRAVVRVIGLHAGVGNGSGRVLRVEDAAAGVAREIADDLGTGRAPGFAEGVFGAVVVKTASVDNGAVAHEPGIRKSVLSEDDAAVNGPAVLRRIGHEARARDDLLIPYRRVKPTSIDGLVTGDRAVLQLQGTEVDGSDPASIPGGVIAADRVLADGHARIGREPDPAALACPVPFDQRSGQLLADGGEIKDSAAITDCDIAPEGRSRYHDAVQRAVVVDRAAGVCRLVGNEERSIDHRPVNTGITRNRASVGPVVTEEDAVVHRDCCPRAGQGNPIVTVPDFQIIDRHRTAGDGEDGEGRGTGGIAALQRRPAPVNGQILAQGRQPCAQEVSAPRRQGHGLSRARAA